jgi:hypothetical protein
LNTAQASKQLILPNRLSGQNGKSRQDTIGQASEKLGIWDLMFLAYHAHKREVAGSKPIKPMDIWMETVADVIVGDADPKATKQEA